MSAYADLIPGSVRKQRQPSAYDDLVPGGTPAPAEAPPAAVASDADVAQAPSSGTPADGSGILDRIKSAIFKAAPQPVLPMAPAGIKIDQPDLGGATTVADAVRYRADKLARERGFDLGAPKAPKPAEPPRASVGPQEGPMLPMGGGTRMEALKALPSVAGDTVVKQVAGLVRAGADIASDFDVPGANAIAERARQAAMRADRSQRQTMAPFTELPSIERGGTPAEKLPGKAFEWVFSPANIAQAGAQAPQLAGVGAALLGAPVGATLLATMGLPVTGQSYHDYREKGYDAPVALLGAMGQALAETVPEVAWVKFAQRTKLADLKGFTTMAPAEQADVIRGLAKGYGIIGASELGSEEVSTIAGHLVDVAMRDPEATLDKLAKDMANTVRQVALVAPVMGGAAHAGQAIARRFAESAAGRADVLARELQSAVEETDLAALEGPSRPPTEPALPRAVPPVPNAAPQEPANTAGGVSVSGPAEAAVSISPASNVVAKSDMPAGAYADLVPVAAANDVPAAIAPPVKPKEIEVENLMQAIKRLGGIDITQIRDLTGEARAGAGRKGIPPGFFHKRGRGLDELANELRDEGFEIPDDAVDGGVGTLRDMIMDELRGDARHHSIEDQQRLIEHEQALDNHYAELDQIERDAIAFDLTEQDLEPTEQNGADADLVARAAELNEAAVEQAAKIHDNDDAAFMAVVRQILNEDQQNKAAARGREEDRGQAKAGAALQLEAQTEASLAAQEHARQASEATRAAEIAAVEAKAAADRQRGDFTLSGSNRAADANPNQREVFGLPAEKKDAPAKVVDVLPSPIGKAKDLKEQRVMAANWARANLVGKSVKNTDTGFTIEIPWSGIKHTIGANSYPQDLLTLPAVPGMLEHGRLVRSQPHDDPKKRADIKAFHTFESRAKVGEDVYRVILTVKELKDRKLYYDHAAIKKETPDGISGTRGAETPQQLRSQPASGAENSVPKKKGPREDPENLGAPASTTVTTGPVIPPAGPAAVGGTQPPKAGAASPHGGKARPDAIRAELEKLFETVISEKHQGRKNLGIYKVKPEVIRVKSRNDLRTIAHEVGHHLSNKNQAFRKVMQAHDTELIPMMAPGYHQMLAQGKKMPWKLKVEEGFAEFFAEYLVDRAVARTKAPRFFRAFESWLYTNPRYREAIKQVADMIGAHQQLSPADRILAKVGAYTPPWHERAAAALSKDTWNTFVQGALNAWHPLKLMVEDLAPGMAATKNPAIAAQLVSGDAAVIEDWINEFTSPFDYAKRADTRNYGKPLKAIFEPILSQGDAVTNDFKAYLIARRAHELKLAGKENLFDAQEIADGLALETPDFKKVAAEVYAYNDRLLDYAVEGGYLSAEVALKFKQYAAYIPFFREAEGDAPANGKGPGGNAFKKLTGGTANIRDPIANLIQNTANIIHAVNRNQVIAKAAQLAQEVPGGGLWMESVPNATTVTQVATDRIIELLKKQGVQIDTSMAAAMADMQQFFTKAAKPDDRRRVITYREGGEQKSVQVNDRLLWKYLGNMAPLEMGLIGKMLALPASTLRAGVVLDPTFMVRNPIRDTVSATIQSKGNFLPGVTTAQGIKMMAQKSDAYKLYRAFGGGFSDQFREPEEAAKIIERMGKRGNFNPASILTPTRWLDALKRVGAFTEAGSRIGEFDKTYKPGDIDSALQAAVNAREVSTDFGMRGGNEAVQVLTRITPFMNPAMQGLYKAGRVLGGADGRQAQVKAAVIGTSMALASVALALLNSDEDWYKRLEEWEKATYWHFKLGNEVYRIPKPFEYGALFASMPEAIALLQQGKEDWPDFKKRMLQVLGQVFGFRLIPQAATIVAEPWANKSIFTGRKLVPDRTQHLEPGLQANPGTSKAAQVAGEAANVSPAIIDNVVRNVFGTLGVHTTTAASVLLEKTGVVPEGRKKTWRQWPAIKAFVRDPDNPNSKQMRDFYEDLEKYRAAVNSVKEYGLRGEEKKQESYAKEKVPELELAKRAEATARFMAKVRKAVRAIERDPGLTPADKRDRINEENSRGQEVLEEFQTEAKGTRLYLKLREASNTAAMEKN